MFSIIFELNCFKFFMEAKHYFDESKTFECNKSYDCNQILKNYNGLKIRIRKIRGKGNPRYLYKYAFNIRVIMVRSL